MSLFMFVHNQLVVAVVMTDGVLIPVEWGCLLQYILIYSDLFTSFVP